MKTRVNCSRHLDTHNAYGDHIGNHHVWRVRVAILLFDWLIDLLGNEHCLSWAVYFGAIPVC